MKTNASILGVVALVFLAGWTNVFATEPTVYRVISGRYETIRLSLLHDMMEEVVASAKSIAAAAGDLGRNFDAESANVPADRAEECVDVLSAIHGEATRLRVERQSGRLAETREERGALPAQARGLGSRALEGECDQEERENGGARALHAAGESKSRAARWTPSPIARNRATSGRWRKPAARSRERP